MNVYTCMNDVCGYDFVRRFRFLFSLILVFLFPLRMFLGDHG